MIRYRCYYRDQDFNKVFVATDKTRQEAIQICSNWYQDGLACFYEIEPDEANYITLESRMYNHY